MKKILLTLLLSIGLIGCSSLELEPVSSSIDETQRILSLNLTHEQSLVEASKLESSHAVRIVTGQLNNMRDEKIKADKDIIESAEVAEMVIVSDDKLSFTGPQVSKTIATGILLGDSDVQNYYLKGIKNINSDSIQHQLQLTIVHNSKDRRNYSSVNLCDKWGRCDVEQGKVILVSASASGCSPDTCNFNEVMELSLSDNFLRSQLDNGFTLLFNSKKDTNKVKISSAYLKGYLQVAN